jgi:hypothetical protein
VEVGILGLGDAGAQAAQVKRAVTVPALAKNAPVLDK